LLPPFIITSGTSESRLHNIYLNTITIILLSVAIVPFLSLRDSLSPLKPELGHIPEVFAFPNFKGTLLLALPLHLFSGWTVHLRVRIRPYQSIHVLAPFFGRDGVRIRPHHLHVWIANRNKNGGPYRCL